MYQQWEIVCDGCTVTVDVPAGSKLLITDASGKAVLHLSKLELVKAVRVFDDKDFD